jgi:hypothetical protein
MGHENNTSSSRLQLPGFGKPLSFKPGPNDRFFLHALWKENQFQSDGITLLEVRMMRFVDCITDKAEREREVFDEEIVSKWRKEAGVDDPLPSPEEKYGAAGSIASDREEAGNGASDGGIMSLDEDGNENENENGDGIGSRGGGKKHVDGTQKVDNSTVDDRGAEEEEEGENGSELYLDGDVYMSEKMFDYVSRS